MDHADARANPYIHCCTLVNRKKEHLYNVSRNLSSFKAKYPQCNTELFDWSDRENCCNVIAITLYFLKCDIGTLEKYLLSIQRSIKNIETNLSDWVIRVYFSSSVFHCMSTEPRVSNEQYVSVREAFDFIQVHAQVEVYRYEESMFDKLPIAHSRTLRFLPLIDPEVNVCNVRESDGIVTLLDCHNMKIFAESPEHLFYLPDHGEIRRLQFPSSDKFSSSDKHHELFSSYAGWLTIYKSLLARDYFFDNQNVYDLVAGLFGTKLKPKSEHYIGTIQKLNNIIRSFEEIHTLYKAAKSKYMETNKNPPSFQEVISIIEKARSELTEFTIIFKPPKCEIHATIRMPDTTYYYITPEKFITQFVRFAPALQIGFDEILLLDLFKDFISVRVTHSVLKLDETTCVGIIPDTVEISEAMANIQRFIISDNIVNFDVPLSEHDNLPNVIRQLINSTPSIVTVGVRNPHIQKPPVEFMPENTSIYKFLYVIDSLLINIQFNKAFNITIILDIGYRKIRIKLNEILNIPYLPCYDLLYDPPPLDPSFGGSKRHTIITYSRRKHTNRHKKRSYRSKISRKKYANKTKRRYTRK